MRNLFDRNRLNYYGVGLGFILPIAIILLLLEVSGLNILYFISSFLWTLTVLTPGVPEKIRGRRYKLSFLKIIYKIKP